MPRLVKHLTNFGFTAENAITANRAVEMGGTDEQVDMPDAGNDVIIGIALHGAAAGEMVAVCCDGYAIVEANAAITKGAILGNIVTTGRVAALTLGAATSVRIVGMAMEDAGAQGDLISVKLMCGWQAQTT